MDIDNNNTNDDIETDIDNTTNTSDNDNDYTTKIQMISSMGFTYEMAQTSLLENNYNVENAINYLLVLQSSAMDTSESNYCMEENTNNNNVTTDTLLGPSSSTSTRGIIDNSNGIITIHGSINQYSITNGRSACTCIALVGGEKFLQAISGASMTAASAAVAFESNMVPEVKGDDSTNKVSIIEQIISCQFIDSIIVDGTHIYNQYLTNLQQNVEHTSVEDIMSLIPDIFPILSSFYNTNSSQQQVQQQVQIRQGILSNDKYSPLNIRGQLNDIISNTIQIQQQQQSNQQQRYTCIIMTKPPETILILLPPPPQQQLQPAVAATNSSPTTETANQQHYILFDSHPRHNEFNTNNGYCRIHSTIDDLCVSLDRIFPLTNLDSNDDDMMSIMYNSFDLYVF